jgi:peptidoglycan/LPS O-acetylase OafA/YrhL
MRINSLDGLRAVSILLVVLGHGYVAAFEPRGAMALVVGSLADLGVGIFFVISGFLITTLLLRERARYGKFSLKQFYIRRAFRILPPFYSYMAVVFVLMVCGAAVVSMRFWLEAVLFTRDYFLLGRDRWTSPIWSLSVEEQFYLLWPACLACFGTRRARNMAIGLIALAPLIRIVSHMYLTPNWGFAEGLTFHNRIDGLMLGCVLAILESEPKLCERYRQLLHPAAAAVAVVFLLVVSPTLTGIFDRFYRVPIKYTLDNLAITYVVWFFVRNTASIGGRALNWSPIVHTGQISYSMYLWGTAAAYLVHRSGVTRGLVSEALLTVPVLFGISELSWRLVEQPALRLRVKFFDSKTDGAATMSASGSA